MKELTPVQKKIANTLAGALAFAVSIFLLAVLLYFAVPWILDKFKSAESSIINRYNVTAYMTEGSGLLFISNISDPLHAEYTQEQMNNHIIAVLNDSSRKNKIDIHSPESLIGRHKMHNIRVDPEYYDTGPTFVVTLNDDIGAPKLHLENTPLVIEFLYKDPVV